MTTSQDGPIPPEVVDGVVHRLYDDLGTGRRYEVAEEIFHPEFSCLATPGMVGPEAKLKVRDGRIVGNWVGSDWLGLLVQLGVVHDPWSS